MAVDPSLLADVLDRHGAALALYARQWCSTAADVIQEALLQLARQASVPEPLLPWLYRVVRNGAVSAGRKERRRQRHEAAAGELAPAWFESQPDAPLDALEATAALAGLDADQREAIVAHLWGGLTFTQIAEVSGSTSSTVHRRYQAGLAALRTRLGGSCPSTSNDPNN